MHDRLYVQGHIALAPRPNTGEGEGGRSRVDGALRQYCQGHLGNADAHSQDPVRFAPPFGLLHPPCDVGVGGVPMSRLFSSGGDHLDETQRQARASCEIIDHFGQGSGAVEDRFCGDPQHQDGDPPHQDGDPHRSCAVAILSSTRLFRADTLASSNVLASLHWLCALELARIKWSSCVFQHSRRPLNHKHVSGESHDWRIAVAPSETFDTALAAAANRVKHSMLEVALCL